jgi:hypothetical protein
VLLVEITDCRSATPSLNSRRHLEDQIDSSLGASWVFSFQPGCHLLVDLPSISLLVQGAHHILGPFGADSDLRRWGLKLAGRGGKNGKKRAVIATARKLAVLLHRLWVSGEVYEPLRHSSQAMPAAA